MPSLGVRAGSGKTPAERLTEKMALRNRFRALVEKHGLMHSPASSLFNAHPVFQILMLSNQSGAQGSLSKELNSGGGKRGSSSLNHRDSSVGLMPLNMPGFATPSRRDSNTSSLSSGRSTPSSVPRRTFMRAAVDTVREFASFRRNSITSGASSPEPRGQP